MSELKRRPYLIHKMLKLYLIASILSTAVMNLNAMIDSILMGNFLGPDAISAITLSNPVELMLNAFSLLVTSGAAVLIGKAFGENKTEEIKRSFTVVVISIGALAILSIASAFILTGPITNLLCIEPSLTQMTHDYVFMQLLIGGLLICNSSMALLTDVAGEPQLAAKAMILQCVVNIFCDTLYVCVLDGGIMFASLATGTGALVSILYMMRFYLSKECPYGFVFHGYNGPALLGEHFANGVSGMIIQVSMTLLTLLCNYFIQISLGADGVFVQSIGFQAITIGFIVANGVGNGMMTLGSILSGEQDITGLHMLFKACIRVVAVCTIVFMVVLIFFAPQLARLFGSQDPAEIAMAGRGLPLIVCALPGINLAVIMSMTMLISGYAALSQIISISILAALGISFLTIEYVFKTCSIWVAYPMAAVIIVLLMIILTELKRSKKRTELEFLSLLPVKNEDSNLLEMSIPCTRSDIEKGLNSIECFWTRIGNAQIREKAIKALRADLENTVNNGGCTSKDYIDLRIRKEENAVSVNIHDTGKEFDPLNKKTGIPAVFESSDETSYSYTFGRNNTELRWKI